MTNSRSFPFVSVTISSFWSAETFLIFPLASKAWAELVRARRIAMPSTTINHFGKRIMGCSFPQMKLRDNHPASPRGGKVADHYLVFCGRGYGFSRTREL